MNSRLEQYVEEVSKGLEDLSETRRKEELTEIRQHLEASVKAGKEIGLDEAEAQEEAVRQFGSARSVSGGLRKAHWREMLRGQVTLTGAAFFAVAASLIASSLFSPFFQIFYAITGSFKSEWSAAAWTLMVVSMLPQLFAGYLVGRNAPRHGVRGTLIGKSALAAYFFLCVAAQSAVNHSADIPIYVGMYSAILYSLGWNAASVALCVLGAYWGSCDAQKRSALA